MTLRSQSTTKAMVLAAGFGLRMRPLTLLRAKPVLPVLNRPLLHWTLRRLRRAGVREVVVNLHHLPETVVSALGDGSRLGLRLHYSREHVILGTGGGPRAVRDFFAGEPFLLVNGDVLFEMDLGTLLRRHRESGARATLALRANPDPATYSPVVTDRHGRILAIAGRPRPAEGVTSLFASVHVMDSGLLERLPEGASDSVRDLYLPLLAEGALLQGVRMDGAWFDLGRPSLYLDAQLRLLPPGRSLVARTARISSRACVRRSVVGAGVPVGRDARIERSVVWEGAAIAPGAHVTGAIVVSGAVVREGERVERTIVLPAAALAGTAGAGGRAELRGDMAWVELA
jgi:mannose-1-phosphate guanylyltransferase